MEEAGFNQGNQIRGAKARSRGKRRGSRHQMKIWLLEASWEAKAAVESGSGFWFIQGAQKRTRGARGSYMPRLTEHAEGWEPTVFKKLTARPGGGTARAPRGRLARSQVRPNLATALRPARHLPGRHHAHVPGVGAPSAASP